MPPSRVCCQRLDVSVQESEEWVETKLTLEPISRLEEGPGVRHVHDDRQPGQRTGRGRDTDEPWAQAGRSQH